jgi:hydrogenase maturation protein HypF
MTSGNVSDEPIAYRDEQALADLAGLADAFLTHDRDIRTREDDAVIRVFRGAPLFLRRSRGYVPRGVRLPAGQRPVLAVGGELKSAACLTRGDRAFLTQHVGDLKNAATFASLEEIIVHLQRLLEIEPAVVAHDLHPDYHSTLHASGIAGLPKVVVQHHHAHLASCMAENRLEGEVLGVIFDGMGYGLDGTAWGGEFLVGDYRSFRRAGSLRPVPMPGGDAAAREPFRMAIAWLREARGDGLFDLPLDCFRHLGSHERKLFLRMLERQVNSPLTSSCGRLFDGVAALLGLRSRRASYEGQAAIELEGLAEQGSLRRPYPFAIVPGASGRQLDLRPLISAIADEVLGGVPPADIAATFHHSLALAVAAVCRAVRGEQGVGRVALSGGVFQNRLLTEGVATLLEQDGFTVFTHRLVPPNDGGLALGQAVIAGRSHQCA